MKTILTLFKYIPVVLKFLSTAGGVGSGAGTYVAAGIAILTGALGLLTSVAPILESGPLGIKEFLAIVEVVINSPHWALILGGFGVGRLRKGMEPPPPIVTSGYAQTTGDSAWTDADEELTVG